MTMNHHHATQAAIRSIEGILFACGEPFSMKLATLSIKSRWSEYFGNILGKPKVFLLQHPHIFHIKSDAGPGNDTVQLVRAPPLQPLIPQVFQEPEVQNSTVEEVDLDLCRSFDEQDDFFQNNERRALILRNMERYWDYEFSDRNTESLLAQFSREDSRLLYEQAYCKCTRLSVFIANVFPDMASHLLRQQLKNIVQHCGNPRAELFFFKNDNNDYGQLYALTYATLWCPGRRQTANRAFDIVVDALNAGMIQVHPLHRRFVSAVI